MNTTVFAGTSLRPADLERFPHFRAMPPARQGDVFGAVRAGAGVIGIVDGYFDGEPAVWHKEILWAMTQGVAVFGAASMGALRAAELHTFGMQGVGRIFREYRDGLRMDDDDVALVHGPPEMDYMALTEPFVNIAATLERAVSESVVEADVANSVAAIAKAQFYQQRTWDSVLEEAREALGTADIGRLEAWLATGKIDQKRADALHLLEAMDRAIAEGRPPPPVSFVFENTQSWAYAAWRLDETEPAPDQGSLSNAILDEMRLDPSAYRSLREQALLDRFAREEPSDTVRDADRKSLRRRIEAFRVSRGLYRKTDIAAWADSNDIDMPRIESLFEHHARLDGLAEQLDDELQPLMLDRLRWTGSYPRLRERALRKASAQTQVRPEDGLGRLSLLRWFFESRLCVDVPDDLDAYAAGLGLRDAQRLCDLVAAEYHLTVSEDDPPAPDGIGT